MAQTLIWSRAALDDVDAIAEYISRDSVYHANLVVERLFALTENLSEHPKLGRAVPELNDPNVRERFLCGAYREVPSLRRRVVSSTAP